MKKRTHASILILVFILMSFCLSIFFTSGMIRLTNAQEVQKKVDIVLVLDNSGSMKQNDPEFLSKNVVSEALTGLRADSRYGMVIFDSKPNLVTSLTQMTGLGARVKILNSLDKMDYKGLYSDTPAAIERAIYELKTYGREDAKRIIILLTDGIVDTGNAQQDLEKARWLKEELTKECEKENINIFGIAFTENADFSLIQTIAMKTGGEYFRAFSIPEITKIFDQIKDVLYKVEAEKTSLALSQPEDKVSQPVPPLVETIKKGQIEKQPETLPLSDSRISRKTAFFTISVLIAILILVAMIMLVALFIRKNHGIKEVGTQRPGDESEIPNAILVDVNGITGNRSLILDKRINMIGRDRNNDIIIDKDTISSFHATIEYRDGFFYLEDQRSINRTSLDGHEIEPQEPMRLKSGDEIMFNVFKFKFMMPERTPSGKTIIDFRRPGDNGVSKKRSISPVQEIPPLPKAILVDVDNITGMKTIILKRKINKIGRGQGNNVEIPDDSISGLHAIIEYKDGFFYLEDQRSKNRTSLGGKEIEPHTSLKLKSGDEIMFSTHKFIFLLEYELPSGDTGDKTLRLP